VYSTFTNGCDHFDGILLLSLASFLGRLRFNNHTFSSPSSPSPGKFLRLGLNSHHTELEMSSLLVGQERLWSSSRRRCEWHQDAIQKCDQKAEAPPVILFNI
jgi:hypothetical protein